MRAPRNHPAQGALFNDLPQQPRKSQAQNQGISLPHLPSLPVVALSLELSGEARRRVRLRTARGRLLFCMMIFCVCLTVLAGRLVEVGIGGHGQAKALASLPEESGASVTRRADIVDRNGVLLATSLEVASLYADGAEIMDANDAAKQLAQALPRLSVAETRAKLASGKRFIWVHRGLTPGEQYEINRLGIPGLYFANEQRRVYPEGAAFVHALGYVGIDGHGLAGVEQAMEDRIISESKIQLSLDARAQHALRAEISSAMKEFRAIGGAGLAVELESNEIVAMASLPDFDPHNPGAAADDTKFNRAALGVYEMGSTFKAFTMAMALDSRKVRLDDGFDATAPIRFARHTIRDSHPKARWLSVPEIFMYSSNIGTVKMAMEAGTQAQQAFLKKLGMFAPVELELPERARPLLPNPWREINTMTVSFGHGISVTPLHVARGYSALVGGGVMRPLTLLKGGNEGKEGERVIAAETSDTMRRLLRLVVAHGTGGKAEAAGYLVGGKTGSAEKATSGGYSKSAQLTSFVGVFPMDAPKYLVMVMLDEPKATSKTFGYATAGWNAAPVASRIIARLGPLLGIPAKAESSPETQKALEIEYEIAPPAGSYRDARATGSKRKGVQLASY